ncbi:MAG TPA: bifunctional DNA primase/polymerase [Candidatus Sulfotelmatobacter sp.]
MSFKDIALPLAARGIPVVPVNPLEKRCTLKGWPELATTDTAQILAWDALNPEYNVACVGKPNGIVILDCDVPGLVKRIEEETGHKFPPTFTVRSAGKGCAHLYFRQTDRSREIGNISTPYDQPPLFDLKSSNGYVVGPGSKILVDGLIKTYEAYRNIDLAKFPDFLGDWTVKNGASPKKPSKYTCEVDDAFDIYDFLAHYDLGFTEKDDWYVTDICPIAKRKHEQSQYTGFYYDGKHFGFHCFATGCEGNAMRVGEVIRRLNNPGDMLARMPYGGPIWPKANTLVQNTITEEVKEPPTKPADTPEKTALRYPTEVWRGTAYGEYADLCTKTNFTPPEFHIEALKTVVGAIAGNAMRISNEGAGRSPRFYTVLMAAPGIGKNTAIENFIAQLFYSHTETGLVAHSPDSLIWSAQNDFEQSEYYKIGVCKTKTSSASGLARFLPQEDGDKKKKTTQERLLFLYPELTELFEKLGIEGSGGAMMSAFCDLYDGETFEVPALANQAPFGGSLMVSLLAGVQPQRWDQICGGRGIDGSGLDERFNLIPTEETRTKANLDDPDLSSFKDSFLNCVKSLDERPYIVPAETAARKYMEEWFQDIQKQREGETPEDCVSRGRLNILAWRNALHYSWLHDLATVTVEAAECGARLSDYQLQVRMRYRPLTGDSSVAKAANAIMRFLRRCPLGESVPIRQIARGVHAERLGPIFTSAVAHLLGMRMITTTEIKRSNGTATIMVSRTEE